MPPNKMSKVDDSLVEQLCTIASVSKLVATNLLEACGNNLEMAVNMHMEGVVTDANETLDCDNEDNVRSPIPQRQEVLVEGPDQFSFTFRGRSRISHSVFDKFRDFQAEAKRQEEELLGESSSTSSEETTNFQKKKKKKTLEDLFRPPLDLMFRGNFQSARDAGIGTKKWLLVNVQNASEFACQVLNRDVWSNAAVKLIIQEHFIFWQIYHDSEEGVRYMNFYPVHDWPYIAIIDPRTGECIVSWKKMDAVSFCDIITEFLSSNFFLDDSTSSDAASAHPSKKVKKINDSIIEADEAAQIEAAIKASLQEEDAKRRKCPDARIATVTNYVSDEDDSDILETFDSDSEEVDYSLSKRESQRIMNQNDNSNDAKIYSVKNAIRARVNRNSSDTVSNGNKEVEYNDDTTPQEGKEKWKNFLGRDSDSMSKLMLRFPDGSRDIVEMPSTSTLMALVLYVESKGFSNETYELVTNFPKKQLSYLDFDSSLRSIGLYPQETIFVQKR